MFLFNTPATRSAWLCLLSLLTAVYLICVPAPPYKEEPDADASDSSDASGSETPELLDDYGRHFLEHDRSNAQNGRIACRQLFADVEDGQLKAGPRFERSWRQARLKISKARDELQHQIPPTPFVDAQAELQESLMVLDTSLDILKQSVAATDSSQKARLWHQAQQKLGKGLALSREGERESSELLGASASPRI